MNNKQATIKGLERLGYRETKRSRKYRTFEKMGRTYMVGKAGALRVTEGRLDESLSITAGKIHRALQELGRWPNELTVDEFRQVYVNIILPVRRQAAQ